MANGERQILNTAMVTFVIPTLNEERFLGLCLHSISELEKPLGITELEMIVIDNFSQDSTPAIAHAAGATFIQQPPLNVSHSRNTGARLAQGAYLAFIDADCELDPAWLLHCFSHLQKADVCGVGTNISGPLPDAPWVEKYWFDLGYAKAKTTATEVGWLPTFNLLVKRDVFLEVGGFNEKLATCEDSDLGYKMSAKGKLMLENGVTTRHYRESKTIPEFYRRERWRGMGNLQSFFMHEFDFRELPSLIFPMVFLSLLLLSPLCIGAVSLGWLPIWSIPTILLALVCSPLLQVLRKRIYPWEGRKFAACLVLAAVYLLARAVALIKSASRIS